MGALALAEDIQISWLPDRQDWKATYLPSCENFGAESCSLEEISLMAGERGDFVSIRIRLQVADPWE